MARCCSGGSGTCACRIHAGAGINVVGTGTPGDPYVVTSLAPVGVVTGGGNAYTVAQTVDGVVPPRPLGGSAIVVTWVCWDNPGSIALNNDLWLSVPR